jgi:hypothetical protein
MSTHKSSLIFSIRILQRLKKIDTFTVAQKISTLPLGAKIPSGHTTKA